MATTQITDETSVGGKLKAWPQRTKAFLGDVRNEMRHVSKPSRKEVVATTTVVLITVALFGVYFFAVDLVIGRAVDQLFHYFTR
jgi:preprotein translocase subunit SecE